MLPVRWRLAALALAATAHVPVLAPPAAGAPADELADKQAQAEQLEREIARNGERISILDEDYNEARLAVEAAEAGIAEAQARVAESEQRSAAVRDRLARRAAQLYVVAGATGLEILDADDVGSAAARNKYGTTVAEHDRQLLAELTAAREDLLARRAVLEEALAAARDREETLAATRAELEDAQRAHEALLADIEGDIARLVAEVEARRRAEEEARVRRELEARARQEQARRTTTTLPAPGDDQDDDQDDDQNDGGLPPAPDDRAQVAVDTALAQLGKPYRYAADGPDSFDCSGLTMYAWAAAGVSLPHSSRAQYAGLPHVAMDALVPGDLVFYGSPIHHVGLYVGDGRYVHAPQTGDVVKISSIYRDDYTGAARPG
jgi:cell wall-associated NlpC family hydrolase